ncbi:hypothetical protein [Peterkaempfera sp. SMS 1(5)a]|uniref:hypothetical protein n=1 Tax=Peterkaempfera podocarpi TaxID=3232308 RepID=UPI0036705928
MTEPVVPGPPDDEPDVQEKPVQEKAVQEEAVKPGPKRSVVRRWVSGPRSRWVVAGPAAVVVVGATVVATAAVVHHQDRGFSVHAVGPALGLRGVPGVRRVVPDAQGGREAVVVKGGQDATVPLPPLEQAPGPGAPGAQVAPAPLPELPADQGLKKAEGAVAGGRVESLQAVPEQGGGSAWQATVLGPDGVRHLVTVDGATGAITSNTAIGG